MAVLRTGGWAMALVAPLMLAMTARADDALPPARYELRQDMPTTGSHMLRRIAQASLVPLNRTYGQLTVEERRVLRSQYESMPEGDDPPFPVDGLAPLYEAIAKIHQQLLVRGTLSMHADVDADGKVTAVSVYKSPDPALTRAAANVLMLTKFKPAVCGGVPCKMAFPLRVNLTVDL